VLLHARIEPTAALQSAALNPSTLQANESTDGIGFSLTLPLQMSSRF
jgi:hypothetical protein